MFSLLKRKLNIRNNSKGFTLIELIIVIGVIAVLAGLTVPAISPLQKRLRQKELDSKAQIIYTVAQNRLVTLRTGGYEDKYANTSGHMVSSLGFIPSDAPEKSGIKDNSIHYFTSNNKNTSNSAAMSVLPSSSMDYELWDKNWVVEYDPEGGSVYAVFYSESSDFDYSNPKAFDYLRDKSKRTEAEVGYYGGDIANTISTETIVTSIEINNGEILSVTFRSNNPKNGQLTFSVEVSDEHGHTKTFEIPQSKFNGKFSGGKYSHTLRLDDLSSAKTRFSAVCGDAGLVPGDNIKITFVASSSISSVENSAPISDTTNSLFGYNSKLSSDTALILEGRHLQNLSTSISNVSEDIKYAVLKSDINFKQSADEKDSWLATYRDKKFVPITNVNLISFIAEPVMNDETEYPVIHGLETEKQVGVKAAGLFAEFSGNVINNITMTGSKIDGSEMSNAGMLIGTVKSGTTSDKLTISNCAVYLDEYEGDLKGLEKDSFESIKDLERFISSNASGGLIGRINGRNVEISKSYVSTIIYGKSVAGGLVGSVSNANLTINESYADSYITSKKAAGLVGECKNSTVTISDCYSAGYVSADEYAAGLANDEVNSITNAYSVMSYVGCDELAAINGLTGKCSKITNGYYLSTFATDRPQLGEALSFDELSNIKEMSAKLSDKFENAAEKIGGHPYNLLNQNLTEYSYPRLKSLGHFGDWQAEFVSGSVVYYEKYSDGTFGVYAPGLSLSSDKVIVGDGYGLLYNEKPSGSVICTYYDDGGNAVDKLINITGSSSLNIGGDYYLVMLPEIIVNTEYVPANEFYQKIKITAGDKITDYYYNPHFFSRVSSSPNFESSESIDIRTARQLFLLGRHYEEYASVTAEHTFNLRMDIDYDAYDWNAFFGKKFSMQHPIGTELVPFAPKTTFNGNYHTISNLSIGSNEQNIGLFGYNCGTVLNVFLSSDYNASSTDKYMRTTSIISGSSYDVNIGAMVGYNEGTVRNCAVAGYALHSANNGVISANWSSSVKVGGFVGYNDGVISNCSADCPQIDFSSSFASVKAGGFAGSNLGIISNSYALSAINVLLAREGNVVVGGFAADNSGAIRNSYCSTALVSSGSAVAYPFASQNGSIGNSYYINGGTYQYSGKLYSYNSDVKVSGTYPISGAELSSSEMYISGFGNSSVVNSRNHKNTPNSDGSAYPYLAIVKDGNGDYIHFGEWSIGSDMGSTGVFYWEYEEGGSNSGYHFSYVGSNEGKAHIDSSLCFSHDDGGVITKYGYGYFIKANKDGTDSGKVELSYDGLKASWSSSSTKCNEEVSNAITSQIPGYNFYAYTSQQSGSDYITLSTGSTNANGNLIIKYTGTSDAVFYKYAISPFFADSIQYLGSANKADGTYTAPTGESATGFGKYIESLGTKLNPYSTRSFIQLQHLNWNNKNNNYTTVLSSSTYSSADKFTYLGYALSNVWLTSRNFYFNQTHDINGNSATFTPIGGLFITSPLTTLIPKPYVAAFSGTYDGHDYQIKNFEINSTERAGGLFAMTVGASIRNVVLYSDCSNVIQASGNNAGYYALGALVGIAGKGTTNNVIENCTVAGFNIINNRQMIDLGGGNIGGIVGVCNFDLNSCTAINNIQIKCQHEKILIDKRVNAGGIAGSSSAMFSNCYSGGSITLDSAEDTPVCMAGILGGSYDVGNLTIGLIIGTSSGTVGIRNSYTYVSLNYIQGNKRSMRPIACDDAVTGAIEISNCYHCSNYASETSSSENRSTGLTYAQMKDMTTSDGLLSRLGAPFSSVTVEERGSQVSGKYSFPGSNRALTGKDYPFPTVRTQENEYGDTVNVHYGEWPVIGAYWSEGVSTMDIFADRDISATANLATKVFTLEECTSDPLGYIKFYNEDGSEVTNAARVASVENLGDKKYSVTIEALKTGTVIVNYKNGKNDASFILEIEAELNITADPAYYEAIIDIAQERTELVNLTAYSNEYELTTSSGVSLDKKNYTNIKGEGVNDGWSYEIDTAYQKLVDIKSFGLNTATNLCEAKILGTEAGEAIIKGIYTYTYQGIKYSFSTLITADYKESGLLGLTNGQAPYNEILEPEKAPVGQVTKGVDVAASQGTTQPIYSFCEAFIYAKGTDVDLSSMKVSRVEISKDSSEYRTIVATPFVAGEGKKDIYYEDFKCSIDFNPVDTSYENYDYLPILIKSADNSTFGLKVFLVSADGNQTRTYELKISSEVESTESPKVSFVDENGNIILEQTYTFGEKIKVSSSDKETISKYTAKEGYRYLGNEWDDAIGTRVVQDMILTRLPSPITYTVKFHINNGGEDTTSTQSFIFDEAQDLADCEFIYEGHGFEAWNTDPKGAGTRYENNESVVNLASAQDAVVDLYVIWRNCQYIVSYKPNGGVGSMDNQTCTFDTPFTLYENRFYKTGYYFIGWSENSLDTVPTYTDKQNVTTNLRNYDGAVAELYAIWAPARYTVTYKPSDGTDKKVVEDHYYEESFNLPGKLFEEPVEKGFTGWEIDGTEYKEGDELINLRSSNGDNVDANAVLKGLFYITFRNTADGKTVSQKFIDGIPQTLTPFASMNFSKTGYTFTRWISGSTKYTDEQEVAISSNVTFDTIWEANPYRVVFKNGYGGSEADYTQDLVYDTSANLMPNIFTGPSGYTFNSWIDNYGNEYSDGASVNNLTSERNGQFTLSAKWKTSIILKASSSSYERTYTYVMGDSCINIDSYPTKSEWELCGWCSKSSSGTYTKVLEADGTIVDGASITPGSTLYAQWVMYKNPYVPVSKIDRNDSYIIAVHEKGDTYIAIKDPGGNDIVSNREITLSTIETTSGDVYGYLVNLETGDADKSILWTVCNYSNGAFKVMSVRRSNMYLTMKRVGLIYYMKILSDIKQKDGSNYNWYNDNNRLRYAADNNWYLRYTSYDEFEATRLYDYAAELTILRESDYQVPQYSYD